MESTKRIPNRAPRLAAIQNRLKKELTTPVLADSRIAKEIQAKAEGIVPCISTD